MYRSLNIDGINRTVEHLCKRIDERFPNSGLSRVSKELLDLSREARARATMITRPQHGLRLFVAIVVLAILVGLGASLAEVEWPQDRLDLSQYVQVLEAAINAVVLIGGAILFLVTMEIRVKRTRVLRAAHELRALAHVIDMHQLTKDPDRIVGFTGTDSSPEVNMTAEELTRYLNYCSELLSLIGKISAYYTQGFQDPVSLESVNEIEDLTTGLTRKIWQKIMILHQMKISAPKSRK